MIYNASESPVQEISLGQALNITLDHYYDLLKAQVGSLASEEFIQLKLVADTIDISDTYKFFSYFNLLTRSDLSIEPGPISGVIMTRAVELNKVYGRFIRILRNIVPLKDLSDSEKNLISLLNVEIEANKDKALALITKERLDWKSYCQATGANLADVFHYNQWTAQYGQGMNIQDIHRANTIKVSKRNEILQRSVADPANIEIIESSVKYEDPSMRMCFPVLEDSEYKPIELSLQYLIGLPHVSTGVFEDRHFISWDKALGTIKTGVAGAIKGELKSTSGYSSVIETDWAASASGRKFFLKVKASASQHTKIQEEFNKATQINLEAKATFRVNIRYGQWFNPNLFSHPLVLANPELFHEFFGENGSLLYYPTALILLRGFSINFTSSSNWTYDYENSFKASAGGGFGAFGINFGGSGSYSRNVKEHKIETTGTGLTISDDESTVRFVGYVLKKNQALIDTIVSKSKKLDFL